MNPSVLRCDSFTLVCVTTDTNRLNTFSPQSFTHTGSADIPSLAILLAVAVPLLMSRALYEGGTLGGRPSCLFLCISHSSLYITRQGCWPSVGTPKVTLNPFKGPVFSFLDVTYQQPRLTAWYGELPYTYSRITMEPNPHVCWNVVIGMLL